MGLDGARIHRLDDGLFIAFGEIGGKLDFDCDLADKPGFGVLFHPHDDAGFVRRDIPFPAKGDRVEPGAGGQGDEKEVGGRGRRSSAALMHGLVGLDDIPFILGVHPQAAGKGDFDLGHFTHGSLLDTALAAAS